MERIKHLMSDYEAIKKGNCDIFFNFIVELHYLLLTSSRSSFFLSIVPIVCLLHGVKLYDLSMSI